MGTVRNPDHGRPFDVLGDRLQPAAEPGVADHVVDDDCEGDAECDHEQRAKLEGRACNRDDPVAAGPVEGERIGEHVRGAREHDRHQALDRECIPVSR